MKLPEKLMLYLLAGTVMLQGILLTDLKRQVDQLEKEQAAVRRQQAVMTYVEDRTAATLKELTDVVAYVAGIRKPLVRGQYE